MTPDVDEALRGLSTLQRQGLRDVHECGGSTAGTNGWLVRKGLIVRCGTMFPVLRDSAEYEFTELGKQVYAHVRADSPKGGGA